MIGRAQCLRGARQTGRLTAAALLLPLLASLTVLTGGCARRDTPQAPSNVLRISQRNEPADLDPATASLPDEFFIIRALGEGLLVPNPSGGNPLPGIAERYTVSDDGLIYTFHLRPNGRWSNGDPLNAADLIASWRRVLTPGTAAPKAHLFHSVRNARAFATGQVTDFQQVGFAAPSDHVVVITLDQPVASFPLEVSSGPWIPVNPRVVARHGRTWTAPGNHVGNGPFTLAEWRPQQHITVRRNEHYHDSARIRLQGIQFVRFDSADTEERAYRAGQIDVTMAVPQTKVEVYERERPDELHRTPLAETRFLAFNTRKPPLNDARVRRALALAIDRDKLARFVLRGGQIPAERFLSPVLRPADIEAFPPGSRQGFDPVTARELLSEAGYHGGRGFRKLELAGWVQNPVLEAIQQMWRHELGIEVGIVVQEAKVHLAAMQAGGHDIGFVVNLLDVRDPATALRDLMSGAPNNFAHWTSAAYDRMVEAARLTQDAHRRARLVAEAETRLLEEAAVAPIYFNVQIWLMSPRVTGWQQDALWTRDYRGLSLRQ